MILNTIRQQWLSNQIRKYQSEERTVHIEKPKSMVVLSSEPDQEQVAQFYQWAEQLNIKKNQVRVLAFVGQIKNSVVKNAHLIDYSSIKWHGGIADQELKKMMSDNYDLQINHYTGKHKLLDYVNLSLKTNFKVGYEIEATSLNDLSIATELDNHDIFITELKKYLNILTQ